MPVVIITGYKTLHKLDNMQRVGERSEGAAKLARVPIKERLLQRFLFAKESLGEDWRNLLAEDIQSYATKQGKDCCNTVNAALKCRGRASVDKIERVVEDMETLILKRNL